MYNRYIPQHADYAPISPSPDDREPRPEAGLLGGLLKGAGGDKVRRTLERLLKGRDLADVLLALIVLLLILEDGDDLELVVALVLMLLPGPDGR